MSKRRQQKVGVFTESEYTRLRASLETLKIRMERFRARNVKLTKEDCLHLFVKKEHHELLTRVAHLARPKGTAYLGRQLKVTYDGLLRGGNEMLLHEVTLTAMLMDPGFVVPDYCNANGRLGYNYIRDVKLTETLNKFVCERFALSLEFGIVHAILEWFIAEKLSVSQMAYFFPAIINVLSLDPITAPLAEKNSKLKPVTYAPRPPGLRDVFGMVEPLIAKAIMVPNEVVDINHDLEVTVNVVYPVPNIEFMGWRVSLC